MSIAGVEATQESFPLCMRQLYKALKKDHHLTHGGRRQLQLYLKGIGMPLDQALLLWKTEFTKNDSISAEKFEKDYAYGIRHASTTREGNARQLFAARVRPVHRRGTGRQRRARLPVQDSHHRR